MMLKLLLQTPVWVWGVLAYIFYVGVRALKDRDVVLYKLYIIPVLFLVLRWESFGLSEYVLYFLALIMGAAMGYLATQKRPGYIMLDTKSVCLKGSYTTIVMLLIFFAIKYIFGFWQATHSKLFDQYAYVGIFISILFPGYFLGRAMYYTQMYFKLSNDRKN